MKITNQDRDRTYNISDIYMKKHIVNNIFFGYNIYGINGKRHVLLGTYDTEQDARQLVNETRMLMDKGKETYTMPEPAMELEDYLDLTQGGIENV